jgi:ABC-type phosphate transport system substrate-binding protein
VKAGTYPIARSLLFLTKGQPSVQVANFFEFLKGPKGKQIIIEEGFIPL